MVVREHRVSCQRTQERDPNQFGSCPHCLICQPVCKTFNYCVPSPTKDYGTPGNEVLRNFCTPSPDGPRCINRFLKQLNSEKIFHLHGALSCLVLETKHKGIVTHLIILWNPVFQHDSFFKVSAHCLSVLCLLKKQEMYIINSSTSMTALNPKFYKLHSHLKYTLIIL